MTVSTKQIKTRIRSMESTKKITKAMETVAASKLQRAQGKLLSARPYMEALQKTVAAVTSADHSISSPYLAARPTRKTAYVVFAGDRGLAGGYNSNILKAVMADMEGKAATVFPVGRKAVPFFAHHGVNLLADTYPDVETMTPEACFAAANMLCELFLAEAVDEIIVAYTAYVSALSQVPRVVKLLPLESPERETNGSDMIYEPDRKTIFETLIPAYLGGVLYSALCESRAAEQAARRTAMDSATQNANEMIEKLSLQFNRSRQAAITGEIIDIIAGS